MNQLIFLIKFFCFITLLQATLIPLVPNDSGATIYYEAGNQRTVEIEYDSHKRITGCYLHGDYDLVKADVARRKEAPEFKLVSRQKMRKLIKVCSEFLSQQMPLAKDRLKTNDKKTRDFPDEYDNQLERGFFEGLAIYPGTKWCGAGDIAENYDDLGTEVESDLCCREHDHCFDAIKKGESKYNLTNQSFHTKSHCHCDQMFRQCLLNSQKATSDRIGKLYFNLIQVQCFKDDHPIVNCLEWAGIPFFWRSCQEYELDKDKSKLHQFFDAKWYERE